MTNPVNVHGQRTSDRASNITGADFVIDGGLIQTL